MSTKSSSVATTAHKFIFIAYKPSSEDYCRGCLMASYGAAHEVYSDLDEKELVEKWASYLYDNMDLDYGEVGYRFWLFMDGKKVIEETYHCYYYDCKEDLNLEHDDTTEVAAFITELEERAKLLAKARYDKYKEYERKIEQEKITKIKQEDEARRRAKYEKLKEEFGP